MSTDLFETVGRGLANYFEGGFFSNLFGRFFGRLMGQRLAGLLLGTGFVTHEIMKLFKASKKNAKVAGALLACALVLRDPFRS